MTPQRLREPLDEQGGVATLADLARAWGVSKTRVHELARHPGFPPPLLMVGRIAVYLRSEADDFRNTERPPGPPRRPS